MDVRIRIDGPEKRRVEHAASIGQDEDLLQAIGVALELYRKYYPDAPPFRKTVSIDHA